MTDTFRLDDEASVQASLEILAEQDELLPGTLLVLVADAQGRVITSVAVDDVPPDPPQHDRVRALGPLLRRLRDATDGSTGVLLVVVREGTPRAEGGDLAWRDAFAGAARTARLTCHGVYVVTTRGVARVKPAADAAA